MAKHFDCVVCHKRTSPKSRRLINPSVKKYLQRKLFIFPSKHDVICNKCKHKYYVCETQSSRDPVKIGNNFQPPSENPRKVLASPPSVNLSIRSTIRTHARCIICKKPGPKLVVVPQDARFSAFMERNMLIAAGTRCCPGHLTDTERLKPECLDSMETTAQAKVNRTSILNLLSQMREACVNREKLLNFDDIKDCDCKNLTGLSKEHFDDLCTHIICKIKATPSRSPKESIGLFLFKLKTGISNKLISTIMQISCSSIRRAVKTVREALVTAFVPLYLGLESVTRDQIIQHHTRPLAKSLFNVADDSLILILDGTYIYIQKSNNFSFQRRSYSVHKARSLVKPMVVVTTTGHFVTIVGPYLAKNNDASILNHIMKRNIQDFKDFVHENDLLVVDRGFRDSISLLEDMGIRAAMPSFLGKGQKQMTTEDANTSRLVTKIRWVVESANGRIKRFKYLDKVLPTNQVPFIGDYVRIVCALSNKYLPQLSVNNMKERDETLAQQMKERADQTNELREFVEINNLERRSAKWTTVEESSLRDFPVLNEEQLRSITCGVYQLKLSSSYIQEHLDGACDIHIHEDDHHLIRVRIQSRHTSARKYYLWIRFNAQTIISWYCKCRAGSRVVGVCAHVAAVIWFLSRGRYEDGRLGVTDWGTCLSDANAPEPVDSSDSDSCDSFVEE